MRRRDFFATGSIFVASAAAGCVGDSFSPNARSEANRTHFEKVEGEYVASIRNGLAKSVTAEISVTDATETTKEETVSLPPRDTTQIEQLFETDSEPYTVSISAAGAVKEGTLQPSKSPDNNFVYTITSAGIEFTQERRPAADIALSNNLDKRVDVRVTTSGPDGSVYDVLTVSSGSFVSFRDVFSEEAKYDVHIRANGMSESVTFQNSATSGLSIGVTSNELRVKSYDL
ncbi:hypothetical protein [Haloterrigena salifodinae]|uniref:hypothetical protein n=1 Tax=Haloterrigena salifodinae TaxID=2675099 RepID=UPI000F890C68|nr:hypothetical protein [Haloterrigena salifodinae]